MFIFCPVLLTINHLSYGNHLSLLIFPCCLCNQFYVSRNAKDFWWCLELCKYKAMSGLGFSSSSALLSGPSHLCHCVGQGKWLLLYLHLFLCSPPRFSLWISTFLPISHTFLPLLSSMLGGWFLNLILQIISLFSPITLLLTPFLCSLIFFFPRNFVMFDWSLFRTTYLPFMDVTTFWIIWISGQLLFLW